MPVPVAAEYPLLNIFWTMTIFVFWVIWIWILVAVLTDVFRRSDLSGWGKAGWTLFVIVLPYLGVFAYLITQHDGMAERSGRDAGVRRAQRDGHVAPGAGNGGGAATEIAKAKQLLDSGAINAAEYESLKVKALA
jgi:Phospholipase_D-nuclease N-terminal